MHVKQLHERACLCSGRCAGGAMVSIQVNQASPPRLLLPPSDPGPKRLVSIYRRWLGSFSCDKSQALREGSQGLQCCTTWQPRERSLRVRPPWSWHRQMSVTSVYCYQNDGCKSILPLVAPVAGYCCGQLHILHVSVCTAQHLYVNRGILCVDGP